MIPRAFVTQWREHAPWQTNEQIEQDLVISRSVVEIFSNPFLREKLAFRGGTALHKVYLPPPVRYSEDIDLVQISAGRIGEIFDAVKTGLSFLGTPRVSQKKMNNLLAFSFESEIPPVIGLKLKIEINCREHFAVFGIVQKRYGVESRWFKGECEVTTYGLEELLGSKLRALYQRKKGRDLFDLWIALQRSDANADRIVDAFRFFMGASGRRVRRKQFEDNMEAKIQDRSFRGDIAGLLRMNESFDMDAAWKQVREKIIRRLDE